MSTLVVTDLDGTLWDYSDRCHPKTLEAIAELERRGTPLLVATGRRQRGVQLGFELNKLALPAVMLNGAAGFDFRTDKDIFVERFEPDFIALLVAQFSDAGLSPAVLVSPDRVVMEAGQASAALRPTLAPQYISAVGTCALMQTDLADFIASPEISAVGFMLTSMSADQLARCRSVLEDLAHDAYSYHLDTFYPGWMVMGQPPGVTKWSGIQRFIDETLDVVDRVVVLGDNANDLPMLKSADLAVGVEGGHPEVIKMADLTIQSPTDGGWGDIVDLLS